MDAPRWLDYIDVDDLPEALENPKSHDVALIDESFRRFGFGEPPMIDERTGRLVAGHGRRDRLRAWRADDLQPPEGIVVEADGRWLVPVYRGWSSANDVEALAYCVTSNRTVERGGWRDELGDVLARLEAAPPLEFAEDVSGLYGVGYDHDDVLALLADRELAERREVVATRGVDPDELPEQAAAVTADGDVWVLGPHRLICADSTRRQSLELAVDGRLADLVWTDPPYGVDYEGGTAAALTIRNDALDSQALAALLAAALGNALEVCRPGGAWFVAGPDMHGVFRSFVDVLHDLGVYRQTILWVKNQFVLGQRDYHCRHEPIFYGWKPGAAHTPPPNRTQDTIWEIPKPRRSTEHPTMKPVALVARAILNHSRRGNLVLDPFAGSGTTLVAAHTEGRQAALVELDPRYCDVICARYQNLTGDQPVRAASGQPVDFLAPAPSPSGRRPRGSASQT